MLLKNLFAGQQWRNRHREQTYGHGESGGEGEMYGESTMETYITICKTDSQWEFAVCLRELKQGLYRQIFHSSLSPSSRGSLVPLPITFIFSDITTDIYSFIYGSPQ